MYKKNNLISIWMSLALIVGTSCHAQTHSRLDINQLNEQLATGAMKNKEYLAAADKWVDEQFAAGISFERDSLIAVLATFRDLAWAADSLVAYRINYFINLSNNANYANREGESVYFLEKAEQEVLSAYGEQPLMVAGRKCNTYIDKRNYKNVIATYEKERTYIEQFPELIRANKINPNISASFINVLNPTINAYAKLGDTVQFNETLALAEAIHAALKDQGKLTHNTATTVNFYVQQLYYYKYFTLENNKQKGGEALQGMQHALYGDTTTPASLVGRLAPVLVTRQVEYFLKHKENDSAAHYLARLKAIPGVFTDHDFTLNHFEAELLANQGQYQQAYAYVRQAHFNIDSIQSILVDDIDQLLYAHTQAEFDRQALQASERAKQQRTYLLIAITVVAVVVVLTIYLMMRRRERQANARIGRLNDMANMQIASMEEVRDEAVREEQKRLARDLHDGLASMLAGIKHQFELLASDNLQPDLKPKIAAITTHVEQAYAVSRGKSHQWYSYAVSSMEPSFRNRIGYLLDAALADGKYQKNILIDDDSLNDVPLQLRIELLRIVQEAVTNIIKHAKARQVTILIYREDKELVMTISDDGKGIASHRSVSGGLGIRSMEERIHQLGGTLTINAKSDGTEVIAQLPINTSATTV